jgi:hypothetical protein
VLQAFRDGLARTAAAPVVAVGVWAVARLLAVAPPDGFIEAAEPRDAIVQLLFWSFAWGGVLDRYARNRPTRARGFFGACGAHLGAMLRLGAIVWLLSAGVQTLAGPWPILAVSLIATYARVRVVVEDRRSALGALLAAARFLWRNPAGVVLFALYAVPAQLTHPFQGRSVLIALLALVSHATAVSLFQSRLAHAGYTAAPTIDWPESPAAEAISNAPPDYPS